MRRTYYLNTHTHTYIYIYIGMIKCSMTNENALQFILIRGEFNKFPDLLYKHLKLS